MNVLRRIVFNLWYFLNPPWDTNKSPPELINFIHSHPSGSALDLGCGTGTNAITLAKSGWKVLGVDFASIAIQRGRRRARRLGIPVNLIVGDVTKPKDWLKCNQRIFPGPFDLILDIGCYHSLSLKERMNYRHNLSQLLAPGGIFLIYVFFRTQYSGSGISKAELDDFPPDLTLISRQDGTERGMLDSAWLMYQF